MNEETLRVECLDETGELCVDDFRLGAPIDRGSARPVWHAARCRGHVLARRSAAFGEQLVIRFEPATPRSEYMLHQYFLRTSLAARHAPWRPRAVAPPPSRALVALRDELAGGARSAPAAQGASVTSCATSCVSAGPGATLAASGSPAHRDSAEQSGAGSRRRPAGPAGRA